MKLSDVPDQNLINDAIERALKEDVGSGDVTTEAIVDVKKSAKAIWIAKQDGRIAGMDIAKRVFQYLDKDFSWNSNVYDGEDVKNGDTIAELKGKCKAVLTAERAALNFVQRMSGIATKTSEMVREVEEFPVKILDTRKTVPGLRILDKIAVKAGGGVNHRMGLYDLAMIKDNHILAAGSISTAVECIRQQSPGMKIEVETTTFDQIDEALKSGADIIMLDNMSINQMREAVERIGSRAETEASGNISLETVRQVAETGVNFISIGALTHSVEAFDISQHITEIF